jgi:membrane-associated phospholipid phosphatase
MFSFSASPHFSFWPLLTRLGEAQLLLPLSLLAAVWLFGWGGQRRLACRWMGGLALATVITTVSKLAFLGWGLGGAHLDFTGFSGHSMFASATLPLLGWTLWQGRRGQDLALAGGFVLAAVVAYSRLAVNAHSSSEALLGWLLGAAVSVVSLRRTPATGRAVPLWMPALAFSLLLLMPLAAPRSRTHDWVVALSLELSGRGHPYTREHLHKGRKRSPESARTPALPGSSASPALPGSAAAR